MKTRVAYYALLILLFTAASFLLCATGNLFIGGGFFFAACSLTLDARQNISRAKARLKAAEHFNGNVPGIQSLTKYAEGKVFFGDN